MKTNLFRLASMLKQLGRKKLWFALFAVPAIFLFIWFSARRNAGENAGWKQAQVSFPERLESVRVETKPVRYQTAQPQVQSFGSLSFEDAVSVGPRSDGTIEEIFVDEGDAVKKGQLLVRLSNLQLDLQYSKAKSALNSARISYQQAKIRYAEGKKQIEAKLLRLQKTSLQLLMQQKEIVMLKKKLQDQRDLHKINALSTQDLADMEFQLDSRENAYEQALIEAQIEKIGYREQDLREAGYENIPQDPAAQRQLYVQLNSRKLSNELAIAEAKISAAEDEFDSVQVLVDALKIRSPINGVLAARQLSQGQRVKIDSPLLTIINQGKLYVVFPLQESLIGEVQIGEDVVVDLPSLGEETSAQIEVVNPLVDPGSGNFTVKARINAPLQEQARQGMFASVNFPLGERKKRILIPKSTLLDGENKSNRVFLVINNYIAQRSVELGTTFEASEEGVQVEVLQGLKEGDLLVISENPGLREGLEVAINEP